MPLRAIKSAIASVNANHKRALIKESNNLRRAQAELLLAKGAKIMAGRSASKRQAQLAQHINHLEQMFESDAVPFIAGERNAAARKLRLSRQKK